LTLVLVFGLFQGFLPKSASASNIYVDNVSFYTDSEGWNRLSFHILTSFALKMGFNGDYCSVNSQDESRFQGMAGGVNVSDGWGWYLPAMFTGSSSCANDITLTAGNTYSGYIMSGEPFWPVAWTFEDAQADAGWILYGKNVYTSSDNWLFTGGEYWTYNWSIFPFPDVEQYFFEEWPTLTITFPDDNEELLASFNITGSFTQPAEDPSGFLQVDTMPAGTYSSSLQSFWQSIQSASSGAVSIWVSNLPAGYYDFRIYFRGGTFDFYEGAVIYNVHIVNDLPFSLPPTQGLPPFEIVPVYNELVCDTYYAENSTYETSTALFSNLCLTLSPVLLGVGGVLTQYSANFTPSNASSTGNQLGQSVVLLRSYLSNLNSFFNGFPVSQFLVLYLIALLIAILIRLIKNLIHLAKPV
jgi:hypothetical protein